MPTPSFALIALLGLGGCFTTPTRPGENDIEFVDSASTSVVSSRASVVLDDAAPANLLVVAVGVYPITAPPSISDSAGNTFERVDVPPPQTALLGRLFVFYAPDARVVSPMMIDADVGGAEEVTLAVHAYDGADPDAPFDQVTTMMGESMTMSSGSITTTRDGLLYVGVAAHDSTPVTSAGAGYTLRELPTEDATRFVPMATEDKIGPAQTTAATFELSYPASWAAMIVTFR